MDVLGEEGLMMAGIFKAYDIRGKTDDISDDTAYKIGAGFCRLMQKECGRQDVAIVVGQDMRPTSSRYAQAVIDGVIDQGGTVLDIGLVSTPMFYHACATQEIHGGCMVTASHNPKEYNGFKFCRKGAQGVAYDNGLREVESFVEAYKNEPLEAKAKKGPVAKKDIKPDYIKLLVSETNMEKPLKIVCDAGNGMAGLTLPMFSENIMHLSVVPLFFELDGTFPNHEANPLKLETIKALQERVVEEEADFGVAFDGDADRAIFIDEKGQHISADLTLALFAQERLGHTKGAVVYDLLCSRVVEKTIERRGGTPIRSRVGRTYIQQRMVREDAIIGGELSGHFFFPEFFHVDDAMFATIQMINMLTATDQPLSALIEPFREFFSSGQLNFSVDDPDKVIDDLRSQYADIFYDALDGASFRDEEFWFNVRKSNTEPIVRMSLEAVSQKVCDEKTAELIAFLERYGERA